MIEDYTNLWTDDFEEENVIRYDEKFKKRFEKNIKHIQQVEFINQYLKGGGCLLV